MNFCIMLLFDTGMRCNEMNLMEPEDIKPDYILVKHGKGSKERVVPKSPALSKQLMKYHTLKKAVYIAIGLDLDGRKDVLGMWVGENESAKFWATVLNGLRNRGVEDIFIACTDNLTGFDTAIHAVFPETEIQNCMIHQLRNSSKYVSYKDLKALMSDLKAVYAAVDEQAALDALEAFAQNWDNKYPKISKSWRENWANLSTYFKYPQEVRRLIYTTNMIEGFNRQLRKVTKSKSVFPTDDSLLKMLYLAMMDITKKWTGRRQDWSRIHAQLSIYFAERMPD